MFAAYPDARPFPPCLAGGEAHDTRPASLSPARWIGGLILRGWMRAYHRLSISGGEHLPARGSFILVANHASHLDTLCLLCAVPLGRLHRACPVAAADYFFESMIGRIVARFINALPLRRNGSVRSCLNLCRQMLALDGNILIIYPEGTRSRDGAIGPFKRGIGNLAAGRNIPVVPCHIEGTHEAWPKGTRLPRPRHVRLTLGPPRSYAHLRPCKRSAAFIAKDLRRAVLELAATSSCISPVTCAYSQ